MRGDDGPVAYGGVIADEDLIGEDAVEHHFMTDVHVLADVHAAPPVDDRTPAF